MAGIQIPVSATFNAGNVDEQIRAMEARFNKLGKAASSLGDVDFNPISSATAKEMQVMTQRFSALLNNAKSLKKTLADTGQAGKNWHEVDWKQVFPNDYQRKRYMHTLVNTLRDNSASYIEGGPTTKAPWAKPTPGSQAQPRRGHSGLPAVPPTPSERAGHSGGDYNAIVSRGMGGAKNLVRGGLALAGVMGVMSMAGRAVDLAKEEAIEQDKLLRGTGDLNNEFDRLRASVRLAGEGLGVTYTESAGLARHYAETANSTDGEEIAETTRTGMGMARAYGLELSEGVSFMAQMRHFGGIGADDQQGRRLAVFIAEAIAKGQSTAKAGEMLKAIANYTSTIAQQTLTAPNFAGFAGALADLTSSHTPGLGPSGAANLITSADAALRQGGGMGEAGLNFTFGALNAENPGINPVTALATAEQGLFGSGQDLSESPYGEYMRRNGVPLPQMSGRSNFEVMRGQINQLYVDPTLRLDAMKNYFGLSTYGHAAALSNMEPMQLGNLGDLLKRADVDVSQLSASGLQNLGQIGAADRAGLRQAYEKVRDRDDITDAERERLDRAADSGNPESLREELARVVAIREQEKNVATETRDGVAELNNTLTNIGNGLLPAVSGIQNLVSAMAEKVAPEDDYVKQIRLERGYAEFQRERDDMHARHAQERLEQQAAAAERDVPDWERERAEGDLARMQAMDIENFNRENHDYVDYERQIERGEIDQTRTPADKAAEALNQQQQRSDGYEPIDLGLGGETDTPSDRANAMQLGPVQFTRDEITAIDDAADGDPWVRKFLRSSLALENWGFGKVRSDRTSPRGASGPFQFMPKTAEAYGVNDPTDFDQAVDGAAAMARDLKRQYGGDMRAALAHYNGGTANGRLVDAGNSPNNRETQQYVDRFDQINHGGYMPRDVAAIEREQALRTPPVRVEVGGNFVLEDQSGNRLAEIQQPTVYSEIPRASGTR